MAIHDSGPFYSFKSDIREAIAYRHTLGGNIRDLQPLKGTETVNEINNELLYLFNSYTDLLKSQSLTPFTFGKLVDEYLLDIENLEWLKKNERACYWLWLKLKDNSMYVLSNTPFINNYSFYPSLPYITSSHAERFSAIVSYLDLSPRKAIDKSMWLTQIKSEWSLLPSAREDYLWFNPKTNDSIIWLWEYINASTLIPMNVKFFTQPLTIDEKFRTTLAIIDLWNPQPHTYELFKIKLKKAWSQRKFREKNNDRKQYNFSLRPSSRKLLDRISNTLECKANECIEKLIDQFLYQELTNKHNSNVANSISPQSEILRNKHEILTLQHQLFEANQKIDELNMKLSLSQQSNYSSYNPILSGLL